MDESINDIAVRTLQIVKEAQQAAHKYNDFGSILGLQDEATEIQNDLERALRSTFVRASRLKYRIEKWESGDHKVELLSGYA